jgi:hypothetical protein
MKNNYAIRIYFLVPNINDIDMPGPPNKTPGIGFASMQSSSLTNPLSLASTSGASATSSMITKSEVFDSTSGGGGVNGQIMTTSRTIKSDPDGGGASMSMIASSSVDMKSSQPIIKSDVKSEEPTPSEKTFNSNELRANLRPIWDKLQRMDDSIPFRVPVDPELLEIPVFIH